MSRVGALVAVALENARSVETIREQQAALQRERDQLDLLLEVTNAVVTQLDTRALFLALAPALKRVCSAEFAALTLYDPEARVLRKHACQGPPELAGIAGRLHRDAGRRVARPARSSDAASRGSSPATSCCAIRRRAGWSSSARSRPARCR